MSDPPPPLLPQGRATRARGRARITPQHELDNIRMPGSMPLGTVGPDGLVTIHDLPGRGRASTPSSGSRGRGVTPERDPPQSTAPVGHGRGTFMRGGPAAQTPESVGSTGATSSAGSSIESSLAKLSVSASGVTSSQGDRNGDTPSAGRGATRGRRDRVDLSLTTRPITCTTKKGEGGTTIIVSANYFRLISKPDWKLLKYRVDMTPDPGEDQTRTKKFLMYQHQGKEGGLKNMLFDGTLLFTDVRLAPTDHVTPVTWTSQMKDGTVVQISLRWVEEVSPTDYHYLQFFNIVLRRAMEGMKLEMVGRNYFDPGAKHTLSQHKLEIWPGYETSIRQHEEQMLLCCDISHKVLRTDTVLDQISAISRGQRGNYRQACEKALLGLIVMTKYNNRTYKVGDINWGLNPTSTFMWKGKEISYAQYYAEKYGKSLRDNQQPLLTCQPSLREMRDGQGPTILIPELCNMTGLTDDQRANFNLMRDMGAITRQEPKKRTEELLKFAERIIENPKTKEMLDNWKLEFNKDLVKIRARLLAPQKILGQGTSSYTYKTENADWSSAFRNWKQWSVVKCSKWIVICSVKDAPQAKEFVSSMTKVAPSLGMLVANPKMIEIPDNRAGNYVQTLDKAIALNPQIVMVVIPNNKGEHYAAVKTKCCIEKPVPSQVMTATVLNKPKGLMSVATKVALQMNCKLGGEPWAVQIPLKNTMIVGYDTYHDTVAKSKSVGALVASLNATFTKFISSANIHDTPNSEIDGSMKPAMTKALRKYMELNNTFPERIIMYRDGVGDGQILYVKDTEIEAIKSCFKAVGLTDVKFTFIIVSKRIKTRFMTTGVKPDNPHSGTIVDDVVTLPERYDFFLVSQSVRQGTVNPTSYNVLEDASGLEPKHIQTLTYKLCHLYYNWPGTVRVPMVCQYAHKLAYLVGESLHRNPSDAMDDKLYFL